MHRLWSFNTWIVWATLVLPILFSQYILNPLLSPVIDSNNAPYIFHKHALYTCPVHIFLLSTPTRICKLGFNPILYNNLNTFLFVFWTNGVIWSISFPCSVSITYSDTLTYFSACCHLDFRHTSFWAGIWGSQMHSLPLLGWWEK